MTVSMNSSWQLWQMMRKMRQRRKETRRTSTHAIHCTFADWFAKMHFLNVCVCVWLHYAPGIQLTVLTTRQHLLKYSLPLSHLSLCPSCLPQSLRDGERIEKKWQIKNRQHSLHVLKVWNNHMNNHLLTMTMWFHNVLIYNAPIICYIAFITHWMNIIHTYL